MLIDHRERLVAVVVHELEGLHRLVNRIVAVARLPLLAHDLAGERRVGIGRITDLLAAADTSHVIGVLHGLAAHDGLRELTPFRPVEMVVTSVVVRDRVAGGRDVARLRLPLIQDILGRAVCRHAREQIRPRGVGVADSKTLKNKFYTFHYSITFFDFCTLFLRLICYKYNLGKFRNNPQFYIPIIICFSYST